MVKGGLLGSMARKSRPHLTIRLVPVGDQVTRRKALGRIVEIVKSSLGVLPGESEKIPEKSDK